MQAIEQLTRALGAAIQLDPVYVRYVAAKEANEADEALTERMRELELLRLSYRHEAAKKEQADKAKMEDFNERFQALYAEIMKNSSMREYQEASGALEAFMKRLTGILTGCAAGEDPESYEPEEAACGGSCGGCKGCA
ncbi:MAG: YlbF family regulator [Oscillospiraceae bacterium]|nr:YlbF family regulator [Oscillospiraceae bacterium]